MSYAFENTPWYLVPEGERLSIAIMQAQVRDGMLTIDEIAALPYPDRYLEDQ